MNLNPLARLHLEISHGVPVVYIDDFYADVDAVRERALRARYNESAARYPGLHARLEPSEFGGISTALAAICSSLGAFSFRAQDVECDFSIVTMRTRDFISSQRHPHLDPWPLFGLVYLTPNSIEGTSFYFSETLGYAVAQTPEQRRAHEDLLERYAALEPEHAGEINSPRLWRKLYTIGAQYNRFVLFPGAVLHAIDLQNGDVPPDISRVRLTQRFIVNRLCAAQATTPLAADAR